MKDHRHTHLTLGRIFERELFGHCSDAFANRLPEDLDFTDAVAHAYLHQPARWDPFRPATSWAQQTLDAVRSHLPAEDASYTALYLSMDGALNRYYGVNAFFMLQRDPQKLGLATLDVTTHSRGVRTNDCKHFAYRNTATVAEWQLLCRHIAQRLAKKQRGLLRAFTAYEIPIPPPSSVRPSPG